MMLVRDLPPGERPMERLARLGPQALKETELLAIILGGQTALEAAHVALAEGLARLQKRAGNPLLSEIRAHDIAPHLVARYSHEPQEHLGVVLLDSRQRFIAERTVYIGEHDHVFGSPRWLLKDAIVEDAAAVILFHNHPSGDPSPSPDDSAFTKNFRMACETMDVELFDHIVVGRKTYYSFREKRRL
jgi:DNA repair protein RadC